MSSTGDFITSSDSNLDVQMNDNNNDDDDDEKNVIRIVDSPWLQRDHVQDVFVYFTHIKKRFGNVFYTYIVPSSALMYLSRFYFSKNNTMNNGPSSTMPNIPTYICIDDETNIATTTTTTTAADIGHPTPDRIGASCSDAVSMICESTQKNEIDFCHEKFKEGFEICLMFATVLARIAMQDTPFVFPENYLDYITLKPISDSQSLFLIRLMHRLSLTTEEKKREEEEKDIHAEKLYALMTIADWCGCEKLVTILVGRVVYFLRTMDVETNEAY